MSKDELMRVHPDFAKLVDELTEDIAKQLGIKNTKGAGRKISSRLVTKQLEMSFRKKKRYQL
jgi:hypothetical protein